MTAPHDPRIHNAAAERNRGPILEVLQRVLPAGGRLLEIASGTGQHAAHFAAALPGWRWQPTDRDDSGFASIQAWTAGLPNVLPPLRLDAADDAWPVDQAEAVYCANMIHIAPWEACLGLVRGAARCLAPQGLLVLYGPYRIEGVHTSPGNAAFDADLRRRDPAWGVRDLEAVAEAARPQGLVLRERIAMPANNQMLVFESMR
jgi:SAM-dependent methyltransferase